MAPILPEHVDATRLAAQGATLQGAYPAAALGRLAAAFTKVRDAEATLTFTLNENHRIVISGRVNGRVTAVCQRCLGPVEIVIAGEFEHLPEDEALTGPDLTAPGAHVNLDLLALVEDELLLACPMIPKHAAPECTPPGREVGAGGGRDNPFDVLSTLRQNADDATRGSDVASYTEE
ncbi:MAG: YceD family protein [Gammaproteobacteria bacterium]